MEKRFNKPKIRSGQNKNLGVELENMFGRNKENPSPSRAALESFFEARLERFSKFADANNNATEIPERRRLANAATLSAYKDMVSIGKEEDALKILNRNIRARKNP